MKPSYMFLIMLFLSGNIFSQDLSVGYLTCEHKKNPIGIDISQPRFSWKLEGTGRNILQSAYSVRVATDEKFSNVKTIWQSGKIQSGESVLISYAGPALKSGQRYFWQVKIWDNKSRESKWSETAFFEMGLLYLNEWKAKWIEIGRASCRERVYRLV
jgi:alpha-L-rhamnosidase